MNSIRIVWAIARHQLALARAQPFSSAIVIAVPINFLLLFVLFALSGGFAPISVWQELPSPQGQAMVEALRNSSTFQVHVVPSPADAQRSLANQDAVATIGIPAGFDENRGGRETTLQVTINNLNEDFAGDIRRGLALAIMRYYEANPTHPLPVRVDEHDAYPSTVSFLNYIAVSIAAVALLLGGLLLGGLAMAREWEADTIKELQLSAVPAWTVVVGKLAGAFVGAMLSGATVLVVVLALGVRPEAWGELVGVMVALTVVFVALGMAIGSQLRSTWAVIPLAFALGLPLFFISGPFGPISWGTQASATVARVFPVVYANAAIQHATYGFLPLDANWGTVIAMLAAWAVAGLALSVVAYRRVTAGG